jgi:hypothetical protein
MARKRRKRARIGANGRRVFCAPEQMSNSTTATETTKEEKKRKTSSI